LALVITTTLPTPQECEALHIPAIPPPAEPWVCFGTKQWWAWAQATQHRGGLSGATGGCNSCLSAAFSRICSQSSSEDCDPALMCEGRACENHHYMTLVARDGNSRSLQL